MSIVRYFDLYLNAGKSIAPNINVNQYDSSEQWVFTLYNDEDVQYTPSAGSIIGIKADGHAITNAATVNGSGQVVVTETQQMTAAAGVALYELQIDGGTHGTANFTVTVEKKPTDSAILSDSDLSLIQEGLNSVTPAVIAEEVTDWLDENITQPTTPVIDTSLRVQGAAADAKAVGDAIALIRDPLTIEQIQSLVYAFEHVAWDDSDPTGDTYIEAIKTAFIKVTSIVADFDAGENTITVFTTLATLKTYLTVTAVYKDGSTEVLGSNDYTLSGTLTAGVSTITVSYNDLYYTTFDVEVSRWIAKWDFTQSLTDEIRGKAAVLSAGSGVSAPVQDENGITFNAATQRIYFNGADYNLTGKTIEYDVASFEFVGNTDYHIRQLIISNNNATNGAGMSPLVYRAGLGWGMYGFSTASGTTKAWASGYWLSGTSSEVVNCMSGKTVKITVGTDKKTVKVYLDDVLLGTKTTYFDSRCTYLMFGSMINYSQSAGDQTHNLVLTGLRIYVTEE